MKKWLLLITSVVTILGLIGIFGSVTSSDKSSRGTGASDGAPAPLPSATRVSPSTGVTVTPFPARPAVVRFEAQGAVSKADIEYGFDETRPDLADHAVPWAAEVAVPGDAKRVSLTVSNFDDSRSQLACLIYVNGVLATSERAGDYVSCSISMDDVYGS